MADELPSEPQLRLDPGGHTAIIKRLDADAAGRFLVTGSHDKTVRVWAAEDGRLLRTIRVPAGPGNLGKVYAVAISPDGERIAGGGWTRGGGIHYVYLFERAAGRMLARSEGLPNVVHHLTFAPDGGRLVAALSGDGIRLLDGTTLRQLAADPDYNGHSYGAAFDRSGRLAVTSYDGDIRLYDATLKRLARRRAPGGAWPFAIAFAPDGKRLAVGYYDSPRVDLLDGASLAPLYAPDTNGVHNGDLSAVAWSGDGALLFAAGRWMLNGTVRLRRWADGGKGAVRDLDLAQDVVMDLQPLPAGRLAFAAGDPTVGVLEVDGSRLWQSPPPIVDLRGQRDTFAVSDDGTRIAFGYNHRGEAPASFDLKARRIAPGPVKGLTKARTDGLPVTNWEHRTDPALAGRPIALEQYEISRSLAIAPDASTFLLGADWWLRLFGRDGNEIWPQPAPAPVWGVTMTPDMRLAVAAYADGTIRWHRLTDGEELLAFFPHADRERWVAWTPAGYYMASPGGEDLIGWQVNRGWDETPEWYTAARFRDRFYRPDIIDLVLEKLDVGAAIKQADDARKVAPAEASPRTVATAAEAVAAGRPPIIIIREPAAESEVADDELLLRYFVEAPPNAPAEVIKVLLDGDRAMELALPAGAGASREGKAFVPLTATGSLLVLLARNAHGWSDPASVRFRRRIAAPAPERPLPVLHLLAVGVGQYQNHTDLKLTFPADDAEAFWQAWNGQKGRHYRDLSVQPLIDEDATERGVLMALRAMEQQMSAEDTAVILWSGHGVRDRYGKLRLLPHEVDGSDEIQLQRTAMAFDDVVGPLGVLAERGPTLVFLDACHAGAALPGAGIQPFDIDEAANRLSSPERGAFVFTACTGTQTAVEKPKWKHGALTMAVLEALAGGAGTDADGCIRVTDLESFVTGRVAALTDGAQTARVLTPSTRTTNPAIFKLR